MSIHELLEKVKPFYTLILILVLGSIFWALWQFSFLESAHTPIKISNQSEINTMQTGAVVNSVLVASTTASGAVVGVKTSKKYYFPWCGTLKRAKPENQVQFTSITDARSAGYIAGGNCKGLQ